MTTDSAKAERPAAELLAWLQIGRDLWRSVAGRFDLIEVGPSYWVAIDAEAGLVHRAPTRERCEAWCREQTES